LPFNLKFEVRLKLFNKNQFLISKYYFVKRQFLPFIATLITGLAVHAQVPVIASFTLISGPPGTLVTITGTNLDSITGITIGDTGALLISTSASGDTIVGYVMPGAVTGPITVTTGYGTATSSSNFNVTLTPYPVVQQGNKLVGTGYAYNPNGEVQQGGAVAISADGNTAIVGGESDNSGLGAAWVFARTGNVWTQQGPKLVPSNNIDSAIYFGKAVALSADGNTALIGAIGDDSDIGAAWIFARSGTTWQQQAKLVGSGSSGHPNQGYSVSLSADGNTAIVGGLNDSSNIGAVWIFVRSGSVWTQQGPKLVGTGGINQQGQGFSVSLAANGNTLIVGGPNDNNYLGAAWIFTRSDTNWLQQGTKLVGTGYDFIYGVGEGAAVSISADGNTAIVGGSSDSNNIGASWIFVRTGSVWSQQGSKLVGSGYLGTQILQGAAVSLSADGNTAIVGGPADNDSLVLGATWVFTRDGGTWTQPIPKLIGNGYQYIRPYGVYQGNSLSLSADGKTFIEGGWFDSIGRGASWIFIAANLPQGSLTADGPFCGSGTGQLTFTATAGTGPFTVVYNDGTGNRTVTGVVSGTPFNVFTNPVTSTTTFTLISVGDNNGDSTRYTGFTGDTAVITVYPNVTAGINGNATACDSVSLTASGGINYAWGGGASPNTAENSFTTSGTYTVTVIGNGGCSATASQLVTVNTTPNATLTPSGNTTFCSGDSVILSVNAASSYTWSNGGTSQSITVTQSGNYAVTVTGAGGCTAVSTPVVVSVSSTITPTIQITANPSDTICAGTNVSFQSNVSGQGNSPSYEWFINGSFNGTTTDTFATSTLQNNDVITCLLTSSASCANPDTAISNTITVTVNAAPATIVSDLPNDTICGGDTVIFTATPGYQTYSFYDNASEQQTSASNSWIADNLPQGNHIYVIVSNNGCTSVPSNIDSFYIKQTPLANITVQSQNICQGDSTELSVPAGNNSYTWSNGDITQNIYVRSTGNYTVTVTNMDGCTAVSAPVSITVNSLPATPTITKSGDTLTCSLASTYQWFLNDTAIAGATGRSLVVDTTGSYTVHITDANGCGNESAAINVTILGIAVITGDYDIQLYPNPNNGNFTLKFSDNQPHTVSLFDLTGRLIATQRVTTRKDFYCSALSNGTYELQIKDECGVGILRTVINK
jgi:hypothetical protein